MRRKKSAAARLRPFWVLIVLLLALGAAGGYYASTWKGFYPRSIRVAGNRVVPRAQILAKARISLWRNVWLQNVGAAAARVQTIPYIETAHVYRSLPAAVRIVVTERTPYAVLRAGGEAALVDHSLRVLAAAPARGELPVFVLDRAIALTPGRFIRREDAVRMRDDYDALQAGHVIVASLRVDRFDDLVATLRDGVRVLLGDDQDLAKKVPLIDPILAQVERRGRPLAAIDLRAPSTPIVVFKKP